MGQLRGQAIVEQSLYDGGRRRAKRDRAELDITALGNEQAIAGVDRDLEVRHAFIEGLHAQAETSLRDEAVGDLSDYAQLVTTLQAGGIATSTDLLRTRVELATAQIEATRARQALAESKFVLAVLMGTPADTAFVLSGALSDSTFLGIAFGTPSLSLDTTGNLDLSGARLSYEQSLADVRAMQRERWPTITLSADAGYLNSRGNMVAPPSERYSGAGYSIGLSFDLPVFDWGSNHLQVQQRQLAAESARYRLTIVQRQQESRVRSALAGISALSEQLDTIQAAISTSQDNFVLTKAKYVAGQALASEVLSARQLVTDMKLAELEAFADRQALQADLQRITTQTR
jgi:outer membrane protein TolC